jgi:CheY-like chemotaxis protein
MYRLRPPETSPIVETPGNAGLIFSVDDEPSILLIRQQILERAGHRVLNATDGATALEIAARAIDLALLDYAMPDVNGGIILREMSVGAGMSL